jgi:hypothetical protein
VESGSNRLCRVRHADRFDGYRGASRRCARQIGPDRLSRCQRLHRRRLGALERVVKEAADQEDNKKAVLKAPIDRSVGHLRRPHRLTALAPQALDLIEPQSGGYAQNTTALLPCSPRRPAWERRHFRNVCLILTPTLLAWCEALYSPSFHWIGSMRDVPCSRGNTDHHTNSTVHNSLTVADRQASHPGPAE